MTIKNYLTPARIIVIQKAMQAVTGFVTALLVTIYLSPKEQGYFYTMGSLLSSYILLDLGLSNLLVQISAKRFTKLNWGKNGEIIPNDKNRLLFISFVQQGLRWYIYAGLLTLLLIPIGFFYFTHTQTTSTVSWQMPWVLIVFCVALCMPIIGLMAILEGSHRIIEVYTLRTLHYFMGACLAWLLLFSGYGLFALAMPPLAIFFLLFYWLNKNYRHLFHEIISAKKVFNWKQEVGILHKRVAIFWLGNFLFLHMPTPIIFYFLGAEKAGQFGLSITIANVLASIGMSKVASIIPLYSHLVEEQDFKNADSLFMKNFWTSMRLSLGAAALLILIIFFSTSIPALQRLLPWSELLILFLALIAFHGANMMANYHRAYGSEPMAKFNLISTIICLIIFFNFVSTNLFFNVLLILLGLGLTLLIVSLNIKNK